MKESIFNLQFCNEGLRYIYNTFSGALIVIKDDKSFKISEFDNSTDLFKENGMLVDDELDEIGKLRALHYNKIWNSSTEHLKYTVAVTMGCQAKCSYCFEKGHDLSTPMDEEVSVKVCKFLNKMIETHSPKSLHITFFGGEPTLNSDAMLRIGEFIKGVCLDKKIYFTSSIVSNGILLNESLIIKLKKRTNLVRAQITLDGTRDKHNIIKGIDCFDTVIDNISNMCKHIKVNLRLNITADNQSDMKDLLAFLNEKYSRYEYIKNLNVYFARVRDDVGKGDCNTKSLSVNEFNKFKIDMYALYGTVLFLDKKNLLPKVKRGFCAFESNNNYCIGPDGNLYKCEHDIGWDYLAVGNVTSGNTFCKNEMAFYEDYPMECIEKKCNLLPLCNGGCMMERRKNIRSNCNEILNSVKQDLVLYTKYK